MVLIASESAQRSRALINVARELSLTPTFFASTATLGELMAGSSRRIVLLAEADVSEQVVACLRDAEANAQFGVIVAADRHSPKDAARVTALQQLAKIDNLEWIAPDFDYELLSAAARTCRRRMLRVSRDDLEEALRNREFFVQYQPKVERNSGTQWRTREAEALVRWRTRSMVSWVRLSFCRKSRRLA